MFLKAIFLEIEKLNIQFLELVGIWRGGSFEI